METMGLFIFGVIVFFILKAINDSDKEDRKRRKLLDEMEELERQWQAIINKESKASAT